MRVGRYELVERLGSGGMGEVWRARDPGLNRWVAVKLMKGAGDATETARFSREARIAANLQHPNIAAVYEAGDVNGEPFIAMELIAGSTVSMKLPRAERVRVVRDAARAVHYAHEQGVIHRDLKPDNIMVADGRAYVMDFGLARPIEGHSSLSASGLVLGTPSYISPEQASGEPADARSDVYGLGATLYALLTGRAPFEGRSALEICQKVVRDEPARPRSVMPAIPADLEAIAMKALEKDPARRYPTAAAFADDLDRHLGGGEVSARLANPAVRWVVRHPAILAIVAFVTTAAAGVAWFLGRETGAGLVDTMRSTAATCLSAVLDQRQAGRVEAMATEGARLEEICARVIAARPDLGEPHLLLARLRRAQLRFAEAEALLTNALMLDPSNADARLERGLLLVRRYEEGLSDRRMAWLVRQLWGANERERPTSLPGRAELEDDVLRAIRAQAERDLAGLSSAAAKALLARMGGQTEEARRLFEQATRETPELEEPWEWLGRMATESAEYDAAVRWFTLGLERDRGYAPFLAGRGVARSMQACARFAVGQSGEELNAAALKDLDEALRLMPSWARVRLQRSRSRAVAGFLEVQRGADPTKSFEAAIEDGDEGLKAEPRNAEMRVARSIARHELARFRGQREDPGPLYELAIRDIDAAIDAGMQDEEPYLRRGLSRGAWGAWRFQRGQDPTGLFKAAFDDLSVSLNRAPGRVDAWAARATLGINWGSWVDSQGGDPLPYYGGAEKDLERAGTLAPGVDEVHLQRCFLYAALGDFEERKGRDPMPSYRRAREAATEAVRINPKRSMNWAMRGEVAVKIADRVPDSKPELVAAVRDFDEALKIDEGRAQTWLARSEAKAILGSITRDAGGDPVAEYESAAKDGDRAASLAPTLPDAWFAAGSARVEAAAYGIRLRQDPSAMTKAAVDALTRGLDLNPKDARGRFYRGTAAYNLASWKISKGIPIGRECRAALADFEEAVRLEPAYRERVEAAMSRCRKYLEEYPND